MSVIKKASVEAATSEQDAQELDQKQNIISEELLKEFISIRSQFLPLYSVTGLISVESSDGIHLREDEFLSTFSNHESESFDCSGYPYTERLFVDFDGVRFFCIK